MCVPIALEEQVRQLLLGRNYSAALHIAAGSAAQGMQWAKMACAETGFLLLHGEAVSPLLVKQYLYHLTASSKRG